ncbi:MAG: L-2-hydroxyglutarate oxidase [Actinomycetota bacterium]
MEHVDVVVVGGGIVGLATAYAVLQRHPQAAVLVLDKEDRVGVHQSGHNSGVIHSGIYYPPGSHKAGLVARSRADLIDFCRRHDIALEFPGKVIVASEPDELPRLDDLHRRGLEHGLAVRRLSAAELAEHEPHVTGVGAVYVPETGITDFPAVCRALATEITDRGGEIRLGRHVSSVRETGDAVIVEAAADVVSAGRLVACAGLHSDVLAPAAQHAADAVRIVAFRGEYYDLRPAAAQLVRGLVYPVPDPRFPFLGVHLTRGVHGGVHAGPNAVIALSREGYRWRDVSAAHLREIVTDPGVRKLARKYWRVGAAEMYRSASKRAFARALQRLVPEISSRDLIPSAAGVRAQALTADGRLVDDFAFRETARTIHVINAPSPAATASLGLGSFIADRLLATKS